MKLQRILRVPEVVENRGDSRPELYRDLTARLWTKPVRIGSRSVGWPENEVATLIAARIAGWDEAQIRHLVESLERARKVTAETIAASLEAA